MHRRAQSSEQSRDPPLTRGVRWPARARGRCRRSAAHAARGGAPAPSRSTPARPCRATTRSRGRWFAYRGASCRRGHDAPVPSRSPTGTARPSQREELIERARTLLPSAVVTRNSMFLPSPYRAASCGPDSDQIDERCDEGAACRGRRADGRVALDRAVEDGSDDDRLDAGARHPGGVAVVADALDARELQKTEPFARRTSRWDSPEPVENERLHGGGCFSFNACAMPGLAASCATVACTGRDPLAQVAGRRRPGEAGLRSAPFRASRPL